VPALTAMVRITRSGCDCGSLSFTSTGTTTGVSVTVAAVSSAATGGAGANVQRAVLAEAVTVRTVRSGPRSDHLSVAASSGTRNAPSASGDRPAANESGCPRSRAPVVNLLSLPTGMATRSGLSFL
jgi:hypothetical protein